MALAMRIRGRAIWKRFGCSRGHREQLEPSECQESFSGHAGAIGEIRNENKIGKGQRNWEWEKYKCWAREEWWSLSCSNADCIAPFRLHGMYANAGEKEMNGLKEDAATE